MGGQHHLRRRRYEYMTGEERREITEYTRTLLMFTPRQLEILPLLVKGLGNKGIAKALHISVETVKEHLHEMLKTGRFDGRVSMVSWYLMSELDRLANAVESEVSGQSKFLRASIERARSTINGEIPQYPPKLKPAGEAGGASNGEGCATAGVEGGGMPAGPVAVLGMAGCVRR